MLQIHVPSPDAELEIAWETIANLVREGKVRYAGVSNFNLGQLKAAAIDLPDYIPSTIIQHGEIVSLRTKSYPIVQKIQLE